MAIKPTDEVMRARQHYLDTVRMKVGAFAGFVYTLPDSPTRTRLMHTPIEDIDGNLWRAYAPVADLAKTAERTPYGYARFWGRIKRAPLLDLPHTLDFCEADLLPL